MKFTIEEKERIIEFDPFAGDFGDGEILLEDKIRTSRKEHECFHCGNIIKRGEQYRDKIEIVYNKFIHFKWCTECCQAMLKYMKYLYMDDEKFDDLSDEQYDKLEDEYDMVYEKRLNICRLN